MSDLSPIRIGFNSQNASPAFDDLWLPLFGGEVLARFEENNLMLGLVDKMPISVGTTIKWPRLWKGTAERHAAGAEMLGLEIDLGEIEVSLDSRPIVHHHAIDDIDEKMSHFEIRSKFATESGRAIAREVDKNVARLLINCSRTPQPAFGPFPGGGNDLNGGAYIDAALADDGVPSSAASRAAAGALVKAIDNAVLKFEERDVPNSDRTCVVRPGLWHALRVFGIPVTAAEMFGAGATAGPFWHQPGMQGPSGNINPERNEFLVYNGVKIYRSPNMGNENVTTGELRYRGDFTNTRGVIFQKMAMVYLQMITMKIERERSTRHLSDFVVAAHLGGGGAVRPELAIELKTA